MLIILVALPFFFFFFVTSARGLTINDTCDPNAQNDPALACPAGSACKLLGVSGVGLYRCLGASSAPATTSNNCGNNSIDTALGCVDVSNTNAFMAWVLRFAIGIGGGIAFLLMIIGIFQVIISTGDPDRLKAGKELITSALIGLLMIIFSVFLLQLIGVQILQISGFT